MIAQHFLSLKAKERPARLTMVTVPHYKIVAATRLGVLKHQMPAMDVRDHDSITFEIPWSSHLSSMAGFPSASYTMRLTSFHMT